MFGSFSTWYVVPTGKVLPISVFELLAVGLVLLHWTDLLLGLPVRIQSDNSTAVAHVNYQGKVDLLSWAEFCFHPIAENCQADFISRWRLSPGNSPSI